MARQYIDARLDEALSLDDVARSSYFSPYHFHRIFHSLTGETVNAYINRKRMEKAIRKLIFQVDLNVSEVAQAGGFSSPANFSKAFKLYFGISPSDLRNYHKLEKNQNSKIGKLFSKYGKEFKPEKLYSQFVLPTGVFDPGKLEELLMKIKVKEINEKQIAYISSPKGYQLDSVFETWDKLNKWAETRGIEKSFSNRFAICHDNPVITSEDKCRYDAAIVVESGVDVLEPFTKSTMPGGKYAVAYYKDVAEKISQFMTEICSKWLVDSGYEPDNYPPVFNYLDDSRLDNIVEMDIYIKLKDLTFS